MHGLKSTDLVSHTLFMERALALAERTGRMGNVPVGAVVVVDGVVCGEGANLRHTLQDPTAHAELIALRAAAKTQGSWRLDEATLYVTLEPCAMCAAAAVEARIKAIVFGATEPRTGALVSQPQGLETRLPSHKFGVEEERCRHLLQVFFAARRETKPT
jgi:tRNA(adenine34) deaminase